ncbi:MAG: RAD55 family ATPase [Promethearchaeati archaeon SRVP18_Atabeyarchaeia-1]
MTASSERVGYFKTGIKALDLSLPEGIPRNSFVLVSGEGGTGKSVLLTQLIYERLKQGEPCILLCLDDSPRGFMQQLTSFGWFPEPFLEKNLLHFIDCYSYRMNPDESSIPSYTTYIKAPTDLDNLQANVADAVDKLGMHNRGAVFIDSITELWFLNLKEPYATVEYVKTWRAEFSKERLVPVFCSHHYGLKVFEVYEELLEYIVDGVVDLRYEPNLMKIGMLVKQLRIRKLKGVHHDSNWVTFTVSGEGIDLLKLRSRPPKKQEREESTAAE